MSSVVALFSFVVTTHSSCLQMTVLFNRKLRPLPFGSLLYQVEQAGVTKSPFPPAFPGIFT